MKFAATFYKKRRCAIIAIRKKQLTVRFTEEEYAALKGKCEIAGMKMEPFVRALVDGCRIKPAPPDSYNKLRQQLSAIGNNLNQLTHVANATGRVSASQLDRAQSLLEDIVVNSVSYADGRMFRSDFNTYYKGIRETSDELCRENRLSVIETDGKGKSYDEWLSGQAGKPTIRGMVRKDVEQAIAAADSFDGFITELQNMGYTVKYGPRVEHMAVRHKDAQRNIRIDRLDPRFSETALREYYRQLHRMPTEMQQEYRQENAPAKPKWQPTELQPTVRRARYLGKLPRRYPKVSGFMACYYHYCALLRKAYHGKSTKRCYFLLREDFLLFSRYQQQTKFLWENHIETMDELLAYKENAEVQIQQLARQRKVLYRQKREPERAAREEKIKSLTQQMKALRHEVYICSDIETDAAEVQEKLRQAELAAQEERNEVKQDEQRRRSSRSDGAGSLTGYRSSH